jgi:pyruvate kinase
MKPLSHRTKIVATIGPASSSREILIMTIQASMNVARLTFSCSSYEDHAKIVTGSVSPD